MFKLFRKRSKIEKLYDKNKEFIEYTFVSLICTFILYFLYFVITWLTKGKYIVANFIAYFVSFTVLFFWDQHLFKSRPKRKRERFYQLFSFIIFRVIGFIIDSLILILFIEKFKVPVMAAKILSSLITFMFNYITNKIFIFKKAKLL